MLILSIFLLAQLRYNNLYSYLRISKKIRGCFPLKIPSQGLWSSPFPYLVDQLKTVFLFSWFRTFLSEDHQFWVNLWDLGMWRHFPYTYEKALIVWLYLLCELSIFFPFISYTVYKYYKNQLYVKLRHFESYSYLIS